MYKLFKQLTKSRRGMDTALELRHIEHILKCKLDIGKNDFLTTYADTMRTIDLLDLRDKHIFKCKDFDSLKEMHDDLSARYNAIKDEKKAEIFIKSVEPFKKLNSKIGDVEFEVVPNTEKLNLEGLQVQHCIYTYLNRICDRKYLAINVTHKLSKERATAGFHRTGDKLELDQLKGFYNSRATAEVIHSVVEFCKKNKINTKGAYDLNPEPSRERPMPGQLSTKELKELREKIEKENEKKSKKDEKKDVAEKEDKNGNSEVKKNDSPEIETKEDKSFFGKLFR